MADHLRVMVGHLSHRLMRKDLRVRGGFLDGFGVIGPSRRERRVAGLIEKRGPAVPAMWQQPEPVNEDDRRAAGRVCLFALLDGDTRYGVDHHWPPLFYDLTNYSTTLLVCGAVCCQLLRCGGPVLHDDDAQTEPLYLSEFEDPPVVTFREEAPAFPENDRVHHETVKIDQVLLHQRVEELGAAGEPE